MSETFGQLLKGWRSRHGLSQLALAQNAGISARHLSFLETGRAQPSRRTVLRLAEALDLPLRERNGLLLGAGFAPGFLERPLDCDALSPATRAVRLMLDAHEPCPAFALDRYWNVLLWNRPLAMMLGDLTADGRSIRELNALDLVFEPGGRREQFLNWEEVAGAVLKRLRRQAVRAATDPRLQQVWRRVQAAPGVAALLGQLDPEGSPPVIVPMRMRHGDRELSWINTLAVFGAAGDVTLDELVVESFFPADEATRCFVEALGSQWR